VQRSPILGRSQFTATSDLICWVFITLGLSVG
jgi:hypothetical protein